MWKSMRALRLHKLKVWCVTRNFVTTTGVPGVRRDGMRRNRRAELHLLTERTIIDRGSWRIHPQDWKG